MRGEPIPAPPGWKMQVFEVVPALSIATRLDTSSEYGTLDVDVSSISRTGRRPGHRRYRSADSM
jgi:hypothetical protein